MTRDYGDSLAKAAAMWTAILDIEVSSEQVHRCIAAAALVDVVDQAVSLLNRCPQESPHE